MKELDIKATLVEAEDWEGLFVGDILVYEGHEITRSKLRELCKTYDLTLDNIFEACVTDDYYDNYLSVYGNFPENLSDVELDS